MGSDRRLRTVLLLHAALWLALLSETAQGAMQSASEALHVHAERHWGASLSAERTLSGDTSTPLLEPFKDKLIFQVCVHACNFVMHMYPQISAACYMYVAATLLPF